ncbi:P1 family peptidase [Feifania hominis]|uniref:P1 family peptidase n=1 Tax=Feifania hominis TaxID=2763660 RepID=A0A926DF67_9FIRM|nr:P1 family peptidase [Feifania hominis]MBC8537076.1 P1 family peptidase [Feifania hominis]
MGLDRASGIRIGRGTPGEKNLITDVPGVRVGHATIRDGAGVNTGVTAVLPHGGNLFRDKVMAACAVLNGFGKTMGLVQVEEMGTIETPILMTNTLSIGTAATALIEYMLRQNPDIGLETGTVNPLVCECNDGRLNDIRGLHVRAEHVVEALDAAAPMFEEGAVGAGTGMCCLGLKGGIGSASRVVTLDARTYTVGALVLSNFGEAGRLLINGRHVGEEIQAGQSAQGDRGSIIMLLATDIPLSERQLRRLCRRAGVGLARTGSYYGNGSGDIAIAFTTANRVPHYSESAFVPVTMMDDEHIDPVLDMSAEAVEEAIVSSLYHAQTTVGRDGTVQRGLREYLGQSAQSSL